MTEPKYKVGDKILLTLPRQLALDEQQGVLTDDSGNYKIRLDHICQYGNEETFFGIEIIGELND